MFKIKLTSRAKKELKQISKSHQIALGLIFEELKQDPTIGKPLARELTGRYSYRVGVYRIVFKVNVADKVITILTAGHRATAYE